MQRLLPLTLSATLVVLTSAPARAQWSTASLSQKTEHLEAVTVGDLALFPGGGQGPQLPSSVVDIYDASTDQWSQAALSVARGNFAATAVGDYALIAGGNSAFGTYATVDVFDAQSNSWSTVTLTQARAHLAATTVGTKAMFAGGLTAANTVSDVVDIYDASIGAPSEQAAWSTATLSVPRALLAAATAGDQALFAGGLDLTSALADVDIYDDSTGQWSTTALSQARALTVGASASMGTRAYFAGGQVSPQPVVMSDVVDIYDAQTGTWSSEMLSVARGWLAATAIGDTVLFAGGTETFPAAPSSVVDLLHVGTGTWSSASLSQARWALSATTVGSKALFGGGTPINGGGSDVVDVYETLNAVSYCFGDPGSGTPCPCANDNDGSVPGSGCANGVYASGARLTGSGSAAISADTLVLATTHQEPNNSGLYFQADNDLSPGIVWGDGLRCAGGNLQRLGVRIADASGNSDTSGYPYTISAKAGNISPGDTKYYQCWYRNPIGSPCGADFNTSNGYAITWLP